MPEVFQNNSIIQNSIENQLNELELTDFKKLDFNPLKMYFGDDYKINEKIIIHQPSIQDFIDSEDQNAIYDTIMPFTSNTTGHRLQLWEMGIDWNKISNYELFSVLIKKMDYKYSKILFGDIDFSTFQLFETEKDGNIEAVLYSDELDMIMDQKTVDKMCSYIQYMFSMFPPEEEFTSSKILKQDLINKDRQKKAQRLKELKENGESQGLLTMISFYLNHPGCKYKKNELREIGYFEFMYNIQRLQIYESTHALFNGMYSGMCDLSKIDKNEFNFMRDVKITA